MNIKIKIEEKYDTKLEDTIKKTSFSNQNDDDLGKNENRQTKNVSC